MKKIKSGFAVDKFKERNEKGDRQMNFGEAIEAVKHGKRIYRKGWNGKGQYVELAKNLSYIGADGTVVNAKHDAIGNKALAFVGTSGVQIGWLASQADMLAEDWEILRRGEYLKCDFETGEAVYHDDKGNDIHLVSKNCRCKWFPDGTPEFIFTFTQIGNEKF